MIFSKEAEENVSRKGWARAIQKNLTKELMANKANKHIDKVKVACLYCIWMWKLWQRIKAPQKKFPYELWMFKAKTLN